MRLRAALALACVSLLLCPCSWARQAGEGEAPAPIVAPAHVGDPGAAPPQAGLAPVENALRDLAAPIRVLLLLSLLVFLPALLLTVTSYTRIIIVLSFVRRAIGAPELPPNLILVGLSLFMTAAVMAPTLGRAHENAVQPFLEEKMALPEALSGCAAEFKTFMLRHTREEDLLLSLRLADQERPQSAAATPFTAAVPAFVLSELRTAFRMGFILFLPFVLIDLVVASILLSLGMFMLPPTMIAMPLKILLFVLVDGWSLVVQSLTMSFTAA